MKRILIDYKKLDHHAAAALIDSYPYGYGDEDLIILKKPNGEIVEAVEVRTEDTIYLVKISKSLSNFMSQFEETVEKEILQEETATAIVNEEENPFGSLEFESDLDLENEDVY